MSKLRYFSANCLQEILTDPFTVSRVQSQVDEVIDVMQENISKVIERGERLEDLQDKSGESRAKYPRDRCGEPSRSVGGNFSINQVFV